MTDLVVLDDATEYLGGLAAKHDPALARLITAVSERIDQLCGPVVTRTITDERHHGGRDSIMLRHAPVEEITTLVEWQGATSTTLTAETLGMPSGNQYLLDAGTGIVWRRVGGTDATFATGRRNIVATYTAGRSATVPAKFAEAALLTIAHYWRRERASSSAIDGIVEDSFGAVYFLPRAALEILGDDLREPVVA